jgi:hypothetical protein
MLLRQLTRRQFLTLAGGAVTAQLTRAQAPSARINVADVERPRILAEAPSALAAPIQPLTAIPAPHGSPHDFFSELAPERTIIDPHTSIRVFRAHTQALRNCSTTIACLSAAYLLSHDERYAQRAGAHLRAWFVAPQTRMNPTANLAGCAPGSQIPTPAGIVDFVPLAELARATSFLVDSQALSSDEFTALNRWFADFATWLDTDRNARIARDTKDHRASAWLLVRSAIARALRDDNGLEACRLRLRQPTLRNQISEAGIFPQEVATPSATHSSTTICSPAPASSSPRPSIRSGTSS